HRHRSAAAERRSRHDLHERRAGADRPARRWRSQSARRQLPQAPRRRRKPQRRAGAAPVDGICRAASAASIEALLPGGRMFPKPQSDLVANTYAYESRPLVKPTGFREYDARWLFGEEINLMGVEALGLGLGALLDELGVKKEVVVGHDFRAYSASIKYALIAGL